MTLTETYWYLLRTTDTYWHLLTLTDTYWHLLTLADTNWHILTLNDTYWHSPTTTRPNSQNGSTTKMKKNSKTKKRSCYERLKLSELWGNRISAFRTEVKHNSMKCKKIAFDCQFSLNPSLVGTDSTYFGIVQDLDNLTILLRIYYLVIRYLGIAIA